MQKKLIAAAVAGLIAVPALAQTNVTISGRFAAGYQNYKLSGPATGYDTYNGLSRPVLPHHLQRQRRPGRRPVGLGPG